MNNYNQEIEHILEEQDEVLLIRNDERWGVRDLNSAVWTDSIVYEKELSIIEKERIADENIAILQSKIDKVKQWKIDTTKKERSDIEFFMNHLHVYHMNLIDEEKAANKLLVEKNKKPKKLSQTIKLPYRDLTCRTQQPTILVNGKDINKAKNDPELIVFVKESYPELIDEEVKWGDFKKKLKIQKLNGENVYVDIDSGLVVDCIKLADNPDKYDFKSKKDCEE